MGAHAEGRRVNALFNQIQSAWQWLSAGANWQGPGGIPTRLLEHLEYSAFALFFAILVALPLGLFVGHSGRGGFIVASLANSLRALPTLGLVVLAAVLSTGDPTVPVLIPVALLAVAPILVNTYEGIRQVDPDLRDAAAGMGMNPWQVLLRAEIPVALPLILLGLRTAAIQVVATATVAAYAGLGGLGRYAIDGLAVSDYPQVVGGAVIVVLLAVVVQLLFVALRRLVLSPGLRNSHDRS
jgi:osmoprotectant transport system permease protein